MSSELQLKNSGGSTLAITHSDSKGGKTIIGTDIVTSVATINDFPTVGIQEGDTVIVKEEGRGGTFILKTGALSDPNNGTIFASSDVTKHWYRQYEGAVNVKWFGAIDSSLDGTNIDIDITLRDGEYIYITPKYNSNWGMTLNGKTIKVLDIHASEQSQWTITDYQNATKNLTKNEVYWTVVQNMISADIEYKFTFDATNDMYIADIRKIYKHCFIPCGVGKEITELQDALAFAGQFSLSSSIDTQFMNMSGATEYFPNKSQITIGISAGTVLSPKTSIMNKAVRIGENNMNGIEIVNEGRYADNTDPDTCIIDFTGVTLGTDDLACINVWKTDLGEIHGITFKYSGDFKKD